jgi:ubiquinone/menaquinone biosynthesis C-methylase UbiE
MLIILTKRFQLFASMLRAKSDYIRFFRKHILFNYSFQDKMTLEVGCGRRGWVSLLLKQYHNAKLYTTDVETAKVHTARDIARELKCESEAYIVADAIHLPFKKNAFDMVVGNAILHHLLFNISQAAQQISYVLKNNGQAVFSGEIVASNPTCGLIRFYHKIRKAQGEDVTTRKHWITTFNNAKFQKVNVSPENRGNYTDSTLKKIFYAILFLVPKKLQMDLLFTSCTISLAK